MGHRWSEINTFNSAEKFQQKGEAEQAELSGPPPGAPGAVAGGVG